MQGDSQQAYDRGVSIFSPDGRVYQVEYAREAVKRGTPSVGVRTENGVVLAAHKRLRSPLLVGDSVEKLHAVDDHLAIASAGHAADARRLVDLARRAAQAERLRYGEAATVEAVATAIGDHVQEHTQSGGVRPYGTALLVAGLDPDPHDGGARLFETDPSGTPYEWRATAVGADAADATDRLEERYDAAASLDDGVGLALDGLAAAADEPLEPASLEVATIDGGGYRTLDDDAVAAAVADLDDGAGESAGDGADRQGGGR